MAIWRDSFPLDFASERGAGSMIEHLGSESSKPANSGGPDSVGSVPDGGPGVMVHD